MQIAGFFHLHFSSFVEMWLANAFAAPFHPVMTPLPGRTFFRIKILTGPRRLPGGIFPSQGKSRSEEGLESAFLLRYTNVEK